MTTFDLQQELKEIEYLMSLLWIEIIDNKKNSILHGMFSVSEEYEFLFKIYNRLKVVEVYEKMKKPIFCKLDITERYRRAVFSQKGGEIK